MLEPDYFKDKEDRLLEIYQRLEDFILQDISRRLVRAKDMTATADRLLYKLEQMSASRETINAELQKYTGLSRRELKRLLENAVLTSWKDDEATLKQLGKETTSPLENAAVREVMDAEYVKTQGELSNLTRTTIDESSKDLLNMLDDAEIRVASGAESYSAAINDILDAYADQGITVSYPKGTRRSLEAAVHCCVVTSMNQTSAQITNQYVKEAGAEYVLVSAHLGARVKREGDPDLCGHDLWQGRAYKLRGSEPGYPNLLESTGYDINPVTGEGVVADPRGLHGYNCRHSHKPWDKRLRNPYLDKNGKLKIDTGENRQRYELEQKQRAKERAIRKTKRRMLVKQEEINGAEGEEKEKLQEEYDRLAKRLTDQNADYNTFCDDNDLPTQYDRLRLADYGRKAEKDAVEAFKRSSAVKKILPDSKSSGTVYADEVISHYTTNPETLGETTPGEKYIDLTAHGVDVKPLGNGKLKGKSYDNGGGYRINGTTDGQYMQYHPAERSHHDGEYYKLSSGKTGKHRYNIDGKPQDD